MLSSPLNHPCFLATYQQIKLGQHLVREGMNNNKRLAPTVKLFLGDITNNLPVCSPVQVRTWLEQYSDAMETSCADSDDVSVREHVGLSRIRFGFCVELNETASQTKNGVMRSVTVIDGHCVRHAVTRDHHRKSTKLTDETERMHQAPTLLKIARLTTQVIGSYPRWQ